MRGQRAPACSADDSETLEVRWLPLEHKWGQHNATPQIPFSHRGFLSGEWQLWCPLRWTSRLQVTALRVPLRLLHLTSSTSGVQHYPGPQGPSAHASAVTSLLGHATASCPPVAFSQQNIRRTFKCRPVIENDMFHRPNENAQILPLPSVPWPLCLLPAQ